MPRSKKTPSDEPVGDTRVTQKRHVIDPKDSGLGMAAYTDKVLGEVLSQGIETKGKTTRGKWADTAYILALRAKKASQTYGKKDFNALYRLVLAAGIAFDKAFPPSVQPVGGNLVIQLFGSLDRSRTKAILEPTHPILDITPTDETPTDKPLEGTP